MATNKLISYYCNICGRHVMAHVAADKSLQFHCEKHGDVAAYKSVQYIQDKRVIVVKATKAAPTDIKEAIMTMNNTEEQLRTYVHGLWAAAVVKDKTKAWLALCAARRAYKMKSVPLWRGALDALINLANS